MQAGVALAKAFIAQSLKNPQTVGLDLSSAPRGSGNLWTRYNVPKGPLRGLGIGLGAVYVGKQWAGDALDGRLFSHPRLDADRDRSLL
jgi:outer membrane receptor for monomeric catechols